VAAVADQYTVTLVVSDQKGGTHSAATTATIAQTNRPPTANAGGPYAGDAGVPVAFSGSGTDPDQDALSFMWWDDGYEVYGYGDSVFARGYQVLTTGLAEGLDIRLAHVVREIHHGGANGRPVQIVTNTMAHRMVTSGSSYLSRTTRTGVPATSRALTFRTRLASERPR